MTWKGTPQNINTQQPTNDINIKQWLESNFRIIKQLLVSKSLAYIKTHRAASFTVSALSTWEDMPFDVLVAEETKLITQTVDGIQQILPFVGEYYVSGCIRPQFVGTGNPQVTTAGRIMVSNDGGATWAEARCLQTVLNETRGQNSQYTQPFTGTVNASNADIPTRIKLQVLTNHADMSFAGWSGFDSPVAASLHIHKIN